MELAPRRRARARAAAALAVGALAGIAIFLAALALAWASLGAGNDRLLAQVRAGFASGSLRAEASWLFGDTDIGVHQFNDCLILFQAADARASRWQRAVSPLSVAPSAAAETGGACAQLAALAAGSPAAPPRFYHRYVHLHTTLVRLLVPALGVAGTRELYRLTLSLLLLGALGYLLAALARGGRIESNGVLLVVAAVFARWFGLESFGQSLGHAPADGCALAFLLFLARSAAERPLSRRAALIGAALFGGATMAFELLTGGLPLGLAMVVGLVPVALDDREPPLPAMANAALAYGAAAASCLLAKLALAAAVFGPAALADSAGQLLFRTGLSHAPNHDQPAGWGAFFGHAWAGLDSLAPGMHWLVAGSLALALVAGGWGYGVLRRAPEAAERDRAVALAASALVPPLWLVIFWQHSSEHAWFMDRLLTWPIAAGVALFLLAVRRLPRQPTAGSAR